MFDWLKCKLGKHDREYWPEERCDEAKVFGGLWAPWKCRRCEATGRGVPKPGPSEEMKQLEVDLALRKMCRACNLWEENMKTTVEFKFSDKQHVMTDLNEEGVVTALMIEQGVKKYYIRTKSMETWHAEDEIQPMLKKMDVGDRSYVLDDPEGLLQMHAMRMQSEKSPQDAAATMQEECNCHPKDIVDESYDLGEAQEMEHAETADIHISSRAFDALKEKYGEGWNLTGPIDGESLSLSIVIHRGSVKAENLPHEHDSAKARKAQPSIIDTFKHNPSIDVLMSTIRNLMAERNNYKTLLGYVINEHGDDGGSIEVGITKMSEGWSKTITSESIKLNDGTCGVRITAKTVLEPSKGRFRCFK